VSWRIWASVVTGIVALGVVWALVNDGEPTGDGPSRIEGTPADVTTGAPAPTPASPVGRLSGWVTQNDGGIDGATVTLKGIRVATSTTLPSGAFLFDGLVPGTYLVSASFGRAIARARLVEVGSLETPVTLKLEAGKAFSVRVVDVVTRAPVMHALLVGPGGGGRPGPDGVVQLIGDTDRSWLDVTAAGYVSRSLWVELGMAGPAANVEVALTPSSRVEGGVKQDGSASQGATVWAEYAEGPRRGQATAMTLSDRDGGFGLELTEGLVRLVAVAKGGRRARGSPMRVAVGETVRGVTLDVTQVEASAARGVVRSDSAPVPGAQVTVIDARDEALSGSAVTGADGAFVVDELPMGRYLVQVRHGARVAVAGPFDQQGDGTVWTLELPPGGQVSGRVEPPQAGIEVRLRQGGWAGAVPRQVTDAEGAFSFEGVTESSVWLDAEGPAGQATISARPGTPVILRLAAATLIVRLTDGSGIPVSEGAVTARNVDTGVVRQQVVTAPNGTFSMALAPGAWELSFESQALGRSEMTTVQLPPAGTSVTLSLQAGIAVSGTVRDAATKLPLQGARITVTSGSGVHFSRLTVNTDVRGRFAIASAPRTAALFVEREGFRPVGLSVGEAMGNDVLLTAQPGAPAQNGERNYEGVGMMLRERGGQVFVDGVNPGSPAEAAGVQTNDQLLTIDGTPVGADIGAIVQRIRGPSGSGVRIEFQRGGQRFTLTLRRRVLLL
jgi:hypothetical protein